VATDHGLQGNLCESFQLISKTPEVWRAEVNISRQITRSRILTVDRQEIRVSISTASGNLFESFQLRFETPKARRAGEPKKISIVRSSEVDLSRQIIQSKSPASDRLK
jgi:hypothetical protein